MWGEAKPSTKSGVIHGGGSGAIRYTPAKFNPRIGSAGFHRGHIPASRRSVMTLPASDIPLIITSAINVHARRTDLRDSDERLRLTLEGLRAWISLRVFRRIVVCDGTGFDMSSHLKQLSESGNADITFESLCFHNDVTLVDTLGKGYGEGEIVEHALIHSRLLDGASSFAKCTSRLWVTNAAACLRHYNGTAALNLAGGFIPWYVDTRFYICSKAFYASYLRGCHLAVDEDRVQYLEHQFFASIKGTRMYRNTLFPTPRVVGISGTTGTPHPTSGLANLVKDVRNVVLSLAGR